MACTSRWDCRCGHLTGPVWGHFANYLYPTGSTAQKRSSTSSGLGVPDHGTTGARMRILIPAVSAASEISGVQRHAFNVAACLLDLVEIHSVDLVVAPWQQEMTAAHAPAANARMRVHVASLTNTAVARNAWFYYRLPALAQDLRVDLVHLVYPMPVNRRAFNTPLVMSLHDLYPYDAPRNFGLLKAWLYRRVLQECLHAADAIA